MMTSVRLTLPFCVQCVVMGGLRGWDGAVTQGGIKGRKRRGSIILYIGPTSEFLLFLLGSRVLFCNEVTAISPCNIVTCCLTFHYCRPDGPGVGYRPIPNVPLIRPCVLGLYTCTGRYDSTPIIIIIWNVIQLT